jgi:hypothetical protein
MPEKIILPSIILQKFPVKDQPGNLQASILRVAASDDREPFRRVEHMF